MMRVQAAMLRSGSSPLQASQSARLAAAPGAVVANNAAVPIRTRNMRMVRSRADGERIIARSGRERQALLPPQSASAPATIEFNPRGGVLVVRQGCLWVRSSGGFRGRAQGIGSENFGVRRALRVLPLVIPRAGKTWNAGLRSNQQR